MIVSILGHPDDGESPFDAAARETEEETGFEVNDLKVYKPQWSVLKGETMKKHKTKYLVYWLAKLVAEKEAALRVNEHAGFIWASRDSAINLCGELYRDTFEKFEIYIRKHSTIE